IRVSEPSAAREKAITSLWAVFVWTKTAPSMDISMSVPLPFRSGRGVVLRERASVTRMIGWPSDRVRGRLGSGPPVAEGGEQRRLVVLGNLLLGHQTAQPYGLPHLLEVGGAAVAQREVLVHAAALVVGQGAVDVVREQLDDLVTRQRLLAHRS